MKPRNDILRIAIVALALIVLTFSATPVLAVPVYIDIDRLLGTVEPGTPGDEANELVMLNFLLDGNSMVDGYNDGAPSGTNMGDNPLDPNPNGKPEEYILRFSSSTLIPSPGGAPLGTGWADKDESGNHTVDLGGSTYEWIAAKYGRNTGFFYIGDLSGEIVLPTMKWKPSFECTVWDGDNGLSHTTLINPIGTTVPDGGATILLLGVAMLALGSLKRK